MMFTISVLAEQMACYYAVMLCSDLVILCDKFEGIKRSIICELVVFNDV